MNNFCFKGTIEYSELEELAEYLKIISELNRLQILCILGDRERCVCEIYDPLDLPQNLVSHHLKVLKDAGLVFTRREGRWIYYRANIEKLGRMTELYKKIIEKKEEMAVEIKILGAENCKNCKKLEENAKKAVSELGIDAEVKKIEDIEEVLSYGIIQTPGFVINEELKGSGRILGVSEIKKILESYE